MSRCALILGGSGRYADPWHPFAETSECLKGILEDQRFYVRISGDVDEELATLNGAGAPDLLVANFGDPRRTDPDDIRPDAEARAREGLLAYLAEGRSLLAMHVASTSLRGVPEWESILGGVWVRGTTMHPEYSRAHVKVYPERHSIVRGLSDFEVDDERYTYMRTAPDLVPLATHEHDGREFPLVWARTYGGSRVVYDALGHDAASYESATHRALLTAAVSWLTGEDAHSRRPGREEQS